jgi:regulator of replication initiation timing
MGTEKPTLETAIKQIEELVEENDGFVFKIAELKEQIAAMEQYSRKRNNGEYLERGKWWLERGKLIDQIQELDEQIYELKKGSKLQIAELEKLWYPEGGVNLISRWTSADRLTFFGRI